jgi:hypothetical protein
VLFDAKHGRLLAQRQITDPAIAMLAFNEAEERHSDGTGMQVLMFSADSIETVHATHPRYFREPGPDTDPFGLEPVAAGPAACAARCRR